MQILLKLIFINVSCFFFNIMLLLVSYFNRKFGKDSPSYKIPEEKGCILVFIL